MFHRSGFSSYNRSKFLQFAGGSLPDGTNTTPEFKVLRETDAIRVFVFDISGSMDTVRRRLL